MSTQVLRPIRVQVEPVQPPRFITQESFVVRNAIVSLCFVCFLVVADGAQTLMGRVTPLDAAFAGAKIITGSMFLFSLMVLGDL